MTTDYFKNLYGKNDTVEPDGILKLIQNKIDDKTYEKPVY
jgi:hypothetical protein